MATSFCNVLTRKAGAYSCIKEGTLYRFYDRLEDDGLVVSEWSIPEDKSVAKKYYRCTPKGEEALVERWSFGANLTG